MDGVENNNKAKTEMEDEGNSSDEEYFVTQMKVIEKETKLLSQEVYDDDEEFIITNIKMDQNADDEDDLFEIQNLSDELCELGDLTKSIIKITHQEEDGPHTLKTSPFEMLARSPSPIPSPQMKRGEKTSKICTTIEIDGKQNIFHREFVKANTARKQLSNRGVMRQKNINEDATSNGLMFEEDGLHEASSEIKPMSERNELLSEALTLNEDESVIQKPWASRTKDNQGVLMEKVSSEAVDDLAEPASTDKAVKRNSLVTDRKSSQISHNRKESKITEESDDLFKPIAADKPVKKNSLTNVRKPALIRKGSKTSEKFDDFTKPFGTDKPMKRHSLPTGGRPKQSLLHRKLSEVTEERHDRKIGARAFKKYPSIIDEDVDIYEENSAQEKRSYSRDENQLRNQSHINTKKISEMQYQFDDARVRIDKLLRRTTHARDRDYEFDRASLYSNSSYDLSDKQLERSNSSDSSGPTMHKTEVHVNPKKLLREVSISIKCEQEVK